MNIRFVPSFHHTLLVALSVLLCSCASLDPHQVKVDLEEGYPTTKITTLSQTLSDLGRASLILDTDLMLIHAGQIKDDTGTSGATGFEIPGDISEMLKSTLNAIGGNIKYSPVISETWLQGHYSFENVARPTVAITGAITEFDRGLEVLEKSGDMDVETAPIDVSESVPGDTVGLAGSKFQKSAFSRITIDFNLVDTSNFVGISKMQTVNTVVVHKAVSERELGFTLFGPIFGLKGSIKKIQGRHAAVRMLVELSMIQVAGKYLSIPYWKLLPNAQPDQVVIDRLNAQFDQMPEQQRIQTLQEFLYISGHDDVYATGVLDITTSNAIRRIKADYQPCSPINFETYNAVYMAVPLDVNALSRRRALPSRNSSLANSQGECGALTQQVVTKAASHIQSSPAHHLPSLELGFSYRTHGKGLEKAFNAGSTLGSGDTYKIALKPDQDCSVYIFQADSDGQIFQLFPMADYKGATINNINPVRANTTYTIPSNNKSFILDDKSGTEKIYVMALREPDLRLENLYSDLKNAISPKQTKESNQNVESYLSHKRGIKGVVSDQNVEIGWKENGRIFEVIANKLENICTDCIHVMEFNHR